MDLNTGEPFHNMAEPPVTAEASRQGDREWEAVLDGDHQAFRRLVEPHLDELVEAARRDISYYVALDMLSPDDLTPEELVGETLLRAWRDRFRRPRHLSLRGWLLGTQDRVLRRIVQRLQLERELVTLSLEQPYYPETPIYDDEESFWEWYQPDDVTTWEDVIPDESELIGEELEADQELLLRPDERRVLLLNDHHRLSLKEIASIMNLSVQQTAEMLTQARRQVQQEGES